MRLVAFLRGINLGNRRVKMGDLRRHAADMGLEDVGTHLASGNLIFEPPRDLPADAEGREAESRERISALEKRIETELESRLGFFTDTMIRSLAEVAELTEHPAVTEAESQGLNVYTTFAKGELGDDVREAFQALTTPDDDFLVLDREVLWLRNGGVSDSTVKTAHLERAFGGMPNTRRKITSLRKLVETWGSED
ncbi:MAG: DUF1697 domain-containing protein [Longimicrobiales bacterium]|nr:DUF1697 domain-containing protein [Longimicrobiales bacterium]